MLEEVQEERPQEREPQLGVLEAAVHVQRELQDLITALERQGLTLEEAQEKV